MILKIGLKNNEQDIDQTSLVVKSVKTSNFSKKSRSANNTLHVDCLAEKKTFNLEYTVTTKSNFSFWEDVKELQKSNVTPLSLIIGTQSLTQYNVFLNSLSHGAVVRASSEFYYSVSILLEEI